ncbi:hypothetical protein HPP92_001613 [Vanilla planifolia]|uniref:Uncharacterized protein n=1 Tax=Vanilla planifolia TaxID=51239 RepID=A0A835S818_VANPL|nr:hypothetical protein HPP92_001613 [Vanilla planifolia]
MSSWPGKLVLYGSKGTMPRGGLTLGPESWPRPGQDAVPEHREGIERRIDLDDGKHRGKQVVCGWSIRIDPTSQWRAAKTTCGKKEYYKKDNLRAPMKDKEESRNLVS